MGAGGTTPTPSLNHVLRRHQRGHVRHALIVLAEEGHVPKIGVPGHVLPVPGHMSPERLTVLIPGQIYPKAHEHVLRKP